MSDRPTNPLLPTGSETSSSMGNDLNPWFSAEPGSAPYSGDSTKPVTFHGYHASPSKFDRFDPSFFSSRGGSHFGHGIYMAQKPEHVDKWGQTADGSPSYLYHLSFTAKPDEILDWERPLSLQPPGVTERMQRAASILGVDWIKDHYKGETAYNVLRRKMGGDVAKVSQALCSAGFKAAQYWWGEDEGRHFVVIDPSDAVIHSRTERR